MSLDSSDPTDAQLAKILSTPRVIAMVGASPKPDRPSHRVGAFLTARGHRVIPINPGHAGSELFGETVRASLADCPAEVEMLDIFRRSDEVLPVVQEALAALPNLRIVWMQLGITNSEARALAEAAGKTVIEDRCPKIEIARLGL